ncbi:MAG: HNH endonuclease signature motif containing protein, partial [Acidimicrobiales bacterium]
VMDTDGTVLDMGRRTRTATNDQKLALQVRDGPCAHPDCDTTNTSFTHAHHTHEWANGGRTDLHNLINLCQTHHHQLHVHGWTIQQHENHQWWLHQPDGTPHKPLKRTHPPPDTT